MHVVGPSVGHHTRGVNEVRGGHFVLEIGHATVPVLFIEGLHGGRLLGLGQGTIVEDGIVGLAVTPHALVGGVIATKQGTCVTEVMGGDALLVTADRILCGRSRGTQAEGVVSQDALDLAIIEPRTVVVLLKKSLSILETGTQCVAPSPGQSATGVTDAGARHSETSQLLFHRCFAGGFDALGDDVHRSPDGWQGQFGGTQAALHLHGLRHQIESKPVVPENAARLHVVHGNAVHQDRNVALLEPADADGWAAVIRSRLRCIDPRRGVQDHWDGLGTQLLLNLQRRDVGEGDGCFPFNGHVCHHLGFSQHHTGQGEVHPQLTPLHLDGFRQRLIAHVAHLEGVGPCRQYHFISAVQLCGDPLGTPKHHGLHEGFSGDLVRHSSKNPSGTSGWGARLCPTRAYDAQQDDKAGRFPTRTAKPIEQHGSWISGRSSGGRTSFHPRPSH